MARVLLIDDDPDLVEANRLVLSARGHDVQAAASAAEAREVLKVDAPDIVVLDVMMESDSAGFDLAREIHERFPNLPTVLLTSIHQSKDTALHFAQDPDWLPVLKIMDKPVDPAALADELDSILS